MRFEWAVTLRYLYSRRRERSLSLITGLALGGVAVGVAALVVAMSVMNGYQTNMVRAMAGALPHLSVVPPEPGGFADPEAVRADVGRAAQVERITPFLLREALVRNPEDPRAPAQGVMLRGVDPAGEADESGFLSLIHDGSDGWGDLPIDERLARAREILMRLDQPTVDGPAGSATVPVLLSPTLARKLGVDAGEVLQPLEFPARGEGFSPRPAAGALKVVGYFETGILAFDELILLVGVAAVPEIYPGGRRGYSLGVRIAEPLEAGQVASTLRRQESLGGERFVVYSWLESNRGLFSVIRLQKLMLFVVLMLIVVIAFFGIVGALVMLVIDKTREIAILKSLGARDRSIRLIFFAQGLLIGAVGTVIGLGLGLGLCWVLDAFPLIDIPPGVYPGSDRVPVQVAPVDLVLIVVGAMVVSLAATVYPARKAMQLPAVNGIRYS